MGSGTPTCSGSNAMETDLLTAARAEALFTSHLPTGYSPSRGQATAVISAAVRAHGGTRGCAAEVAGAYGERPETAAPRMRWARAVVIYLWRSMPGSDQAKIAQ